MSQLHAANQSAWTTWRQTVPSFRFNR